jgi:hypothetical protein
MMDKSIINRFWEKVQVLSNDECWIWKNTIDKTNKRGRFVINGKKYYPIHLMFLLHDGIDVPSGMKAYNLCGNYSCVNPNHYELGTQFGREVHNEIRYKKPLDVRFWNLVNIRGENDCWEWKASLDTKGYGQFNINGKMNGSHRIAWILTNGEISGNLNVCHHCDNPKCCNPKHLFLGTQADNMLDMMLKKRHWKWNQKKTIP